MANYQIRISSILITLLLMSIALAGCNNHSTSNMKPVENIAQVNKTDKNISDLGEDASHKTSNDNKAAASINNDKNTVSNKSKNNTNIQQPAPLPVKKSSPAPAPINTNNSGVPAVNPIAPKQVDKPIDSPPESTVSTLDSLSSLIKTNLEQGKDTVVTLASGTSSSNIADLAINTAQNYGYGGYISDVEYSLQNSTAYIHFNYKGGKDSFLSKISVVNAKVQNIVNSIIKPGMNDYQKELAIHDYVINNTSYDYNNLLKGTIPDDSYTAYGLFTKSIAVCSGYSEAMYRLLNTAGVKCLIISGKGNNTPHAWNLVKISGSYYHVDTTFDDPVSDSGNVLSYNYFNLNDSQIAKDHTWTPSNYPGCSSTADNYFIINQLTANNAEEFYNVIKNALLNKQSIIRCKTASYDQNIYNPQVVFNVLKDNPNINFVDVTQGFSYSYSNNSLVMEIYMRYK